MKLSDQDKIDIVKKYKEGKSSRLLGNEYGVSYKSIISILKTRNIERKKHGRPKKS